MNENIKVFLRIKPNIENFSKLKDDDCAIYKVKNNQLLLFENKKSYNDINEIITKTFNFNHVFDVHNNQNDIFQLIGKNLINNFINGYNSSILAYGNTNSGKTYTLYGDRTDLDNADDNGLIYYSLNYFFQLQNINKNIEISISVVEIYLEKTRDLGKLFQLSQSPTTTDETISYYSKFHDNNIREDKKGNTYVENITLLPVKNIEDVKNIINLCFKYRKTYATKKNLVSSREREFFSQINFIDLAGSEKFNDIKMVNKKELININNTLSVLNRVIISLSTKNKIAKNINRTKSNDKFKSEVENSYNVHIPYRDSKLTRLLKNSLNGNSFMHILICLNLNCHKIEDFINSLIFSKRCKMIKQKITKNKISSNSQNSDNNKSISSEEDYESFDSSFESLQFLKKNNNNDDRTNEIITNPNNYIYHFKKKNIKFKIINHTSDIMINKLMELFTNIIRHKYNNLIKKKNDIINNLIKVVKAEENNKEQLKINHNYLLNLLKKKKTKLNKNTQYLNDLLYANQKESNTQNVPTIAQNNDNQNLKDLEKQNTIPLTLNNSNPASSIPYQSVQNYSSYVKIEENHFLPISKSLSIKGTDGIIQYANAATSPIHTSTTIATSPVHTTTATSPVHTTTATSPIHTSTTIATSPSPTTSYLYENMNQKKKQIELVYTDISKILQMETNKLNDKINTILKLNYLNVILFKNIQVLANILKNVYNNKYSLILKNGKKSLNITNYDYEKLKQTYDEIIIGVQLSNHIQDENSSLKNLNQNIVSIYQQINEKYNQNLISKEI
ncbi:kinesin-like protein, putative [Plasmodium vinckei vinckei]|uniref:Kinesin-like protein n=1 Tax=Plasmodium vinckei vinckei TaxID=54757 RepID=A0A449BTA4_PLAVN|nr:kinesin-like protein, putative [Plasmodium vinckei vinckei]VEV56638.1 kinesin-like protein, putative [Plasmodium vinckei vinckei]